MIYTSFTNSVKTRDYRLFCIMMDIRFGPATARWRTPAENRTVNQFLLAVNTGRRAVFINLNRDLAVIVEPRNIESAGKYGYVTERSRELRRQDLIRIDLADSSFEGPSKMHKELFIRWHTAFCESMKPYSWQSTAREIVTYLSPEQLSNPRGIDWSTVTWELAK